MSILNDLVSQTEDKVLRDRIKLEVNRLTKQKKFGLVFEENLPETTPRYDVPIKKGFLLAKRHGAITDFYLCTNVDGDKIMCVDKKMSKADLRKFSGVSPNTMTKLRRYEPVMLNVLDKICKTLGVNYVGIVDYIADEEGSDKS